MSRLPLRDPEEMPSEYEAVEGLSEDYRASYMVTRRVGQSTSHVLRSLANNMPLQKFHTNAYLTLWQEDVTGLTPVETELVILATGRALESAYEWNSHARTALEMGLTEQEIISISRGDFDELDEQLRALAQYVTAMMNFEVTDELHEMLAEYYDDRTIVGIQVLAGYYALCAFIIDALAIEADDSGEDFVGWELEHLDTG